MADTKCRRRGVPLSESLGVSLLTLRQMLNVQRHRDPSMLARLVDRDSGRGKLWLRKCSDRHDNELFVTFEAPVDGGAAVRTEPKGDVVAFVTDAHILVRLADDLGCLRPETRLSAKDAAGAALAGKTVADGYPERLFGYGDRELTTATRCDSR